MIKIIEKVASQICPSCKCKFEYEAADVKMMNAKRYVICPQCTNFVEVNNTELKDILNLKVYLKIPMTTHYSGDLSEFDESKTYVVKGTEFCEKDKFGDSVCCWYVSTVFGAVKDYEWLIREIAECGCVPTIQEIRNGLFQ